MESFLLGFFTDQLSTYIKDFRKEQVNANLLNGKGEISNFELNVDYLNGQLHSMISAPYIEFKSIKVNKLGIVVTSFANIKRSPVIIYIDEIDVDMVEPLKFAANAAEEQQKLLEAAVAAKNQKTAPYSLFDRISDNTTLEINRIRFTLQTVGCFKTRRKGPWNPPSITCTWYNLRYVSVDEFGDEGPPEQVWRHDSKAGRKGTNTSGDESKMDSGSTGSGGRSKLLHIFKRLSLDVSFGLILPTTPSENGDINKQETKNTDPAASTQSSPSTPKRNIITLLERTPVLSHTILQRRLRDATLQSVQMDMTVSNIEAEIHADAITHIVHALAGMSFCTYKDRSFQDPLLSIEDEKKRQKRIQKEEEARKLESVESVEVALSAPSSYQDEGDGENDTGGQNQVLIPEISCNSDVTDFDGEEEDIEEKNARESIVLLNKQLIEDEENADDDDEEEETVNEEEVTPLPPSVKKITTTTTTSTTTTTTIQTAEKTTKKTTKISPAKKKQPTQKVKKRDTSIGIGSFMIRDKLSLSLSVHHCCVRAAYPKEIGGGYIQLMFKGLVSELIWPKITGERGGYAQLSMSYISLQERYNDSTKSLIHGGIRQGWHEGSGAFDNDLTPDSSSQDKNQKPPPDISNDENFPLFESRSIKDDPAGLRHSFPVQAIGLKTTVDYLMMETPDSLEKVERMVILNELGLNHMEIIFDSDAWGRMARFLSNEEGGGFDPRWTSGDWSDDLTTEMLVSPSKILKLDDHIQVIPEFYLDDNNMISSDLFNVTAKLTKFDFRLPAPVHKDVRSSDINISMDEMMFIVSSALPRSFLTGQISGLSETDKDQDEAKESIEFPNDPSDICYSTCLGVDLHSGSKGSKISSKKSTFRLQFNMSGFRVQVVPVLPFYNAVEPQTIIAPAKYTMIASFDGEAPLEDDTMRITLCLSMLIQRLDLNIDFDIIASAASTMLYHLQLSMENFTIVTDLLYPELPPAEASLEQSALEKPSTSIRESNFLMKKRRVLVKKQLTRSRKTNGLTVISCFHVPEFQFCLWRQHVPLSNRSKVYETTSLQNVPMPLLLLSRIRLSNIELGYESFESTKEGVATGQEMDLQEKRTIIKCYFSDGRIEVCDFDAVLDNHQQTCTDEKKENEENNLPTKDEKKKTKETQYEILDEEMTEIFSIGEVDSTLKGPMIRIEHQVGDVSCSSCALEVSTGGLLQVKIDILERLLTLIIEALLMPTGICCQEFCMQTPFSDTDFVSASSSIEFPSGSIGALLLRIPVSPTSKATQPDHVSGNLIEPHATPQCPMDIPVTKLGFSLARFHVHNFAVVIPDCDDPNLGSQKRHFLFLLNEATVINGNFDKYPGEAKSKDHMLATVSGTGKVWDQCFVDKEKGLHNIIKTKQSLLLNEEKRKDEMKVLVPAFEVNAYHHPKKLTASFGNCNVSFDDMDTWKQFYASVQTCEIQGTKFLNSVPFVLSSLRTDDECQSANGTIRSPTNDKVCKSNSEIKTSLSTDSKSTGINPLLTACNEVSISIEAVQSLISQIRLSLGSNEQEYRSAVAKKQKELDRMNSLLFLKERQRIAALALVSSQTCGWLRMGGTCHMGQRTSTTTTLWKYWVCLRNSLLIIFSSPGNTKPVDIISLRGASLRSLTGGRKTSEIRRGFALVESNGRYRFFVTANGAEYGMWIVGLTEVINAFTPPTLEHSDNNSDKPQLNNAKDQSYNHVPESGSNEKPTVDISYSAGSLKSESDAGEFPAVIISNLVGMGFPEDQVISTLKASRGNPDLAVEYLLKGTPFSTDGSDKTPPEDILNTLANENLEKDEKILHQHVPISAPENKAEDDTYNFLERKSLASEVATAEGESDQNISSDDMMKKMHTAKDDLLNSESQDGKDLQSQQQQDTFSARSKPEINPIDNTLNVVSNEHSSTLPESAAKETADETINAPFTKALIQKSFAGVDSAHSKSSGQQRGQQLRQKFSTIKATNKRRFGDTRSKFSAAMKTVRENAKAVDDKSATASAVENSAEKLNNDTISQKQSTSARAEEGSSVKETAMTQTPTPNIQPLSSTFVSTPPGSSNNNDIDQNIAAEKQASNSLTDTSVTQEATMDNESAEEKDFEVVSLDNEGLQVNPGTATHREKVPPRGAAVTFDEDNSSLADDNSQMNQDAGTIKLSTTERRQQIKNRMFKITSTVTKAKQLSNEKFQRTKMNFRSGGSGGNIQKGSNHGSDGGLKQPGAVKLKSTRLASDTPQIKDDDRHLENKGEQLSCIAGSWFVTVRGIKCTDKLNLVQTENNFKSAQSQPEGKDRTTQNMNTENVENLQYLFHIKVACTSMTGKEKTPKSQDIVKSLSDALALHTVVSEAVSNIHDVENFSDLSIAPSPEIASDMKLSILETVRLTGEMLGGALTTTEDDAGNEFVHEYRCDMMQEFLNSVLTSPLPAVARSATTAFLGICDLVVLDQRNGIRTEGIPLADTSEDLAQSSKLGDDILAISAACESQLARAKNSGLIAQKLASSVPLQAPPASEDPFHDVSRNYIPASTPNSSQSGLCGALMAVMAERDEAHAKLIAANVLHVHEMEQKSKKIEHLTRKLEMAEKIAEGGSSASFFLGQDQIEKTKLKRYEQEMAETADAELMAICRQLSSEISARTSAALEIIRLKEIRKNEQKSELAERQALQSELDLYKEMVKKEQMKTREARRDALEWKRSFDKVVSIREDEDGA